MRDTGATSDQPWPVPGAQAILNDNLLELDRGLRRAAVRTAGAISKPQGVALSVRAVVYRRHQRCAVAGDTFSAAAAALNVCPDTTRSTSAIRPAGPSLASACNCIRHSLWTGPDVFSDVHNVPRHIN